MGGGRRYGCEMGHEGKEEETYRSTISPFSFSMEACEDLRFIERCYEVLRSTEGGCRWWKCRCQSAVVWHRNCPCQVFATLVSAYLPYQNPKPMSCSGSVVCTACGSANYDDSPSLLLYTVASTSDIGCSAGQTFCDRWIPSSACGDQLIYHIYLVLDVAVL